MLIRNAFYLLHTVGPVVPISFYEARSNMQGRYINYYAPSPTERYRHTLYLNKKLVHKAIPLNYNWRKREDTAYTVGAVWNVRVLHRSPVPLVITEVDDDICTLRLINAPEHATLRMTKEHLACFVNERPRKKLVFEPGEISPEVVQNGEAGPVSWAMHIGSLPEPFLSHFLNTGTLIMEDFDTLLIDTEVLRGPKVSVSVHRLDLSSVDPQRVTFEEARSLRLDQLNAVQSALPVHPSNLDPDDPTHMQMLRAAIALTKPGYLDPMEPVATLQRTNPAAFTLKSRTIFYPHKNPDEPRLLRYFASINDLVRGRVSVAKPGRVVRLLEPEADDEFVKQRANAIAMDILPSTFEILTDPADIIAAYRDGPSSCASYPIVRYNNLFSQLQNIPSEEHMQYHPTAVFGGDSDTALAVHKKGDAIVERAVINTVTNKYPRIYSREGAQNQPLGTWLSENGYTQDNKALIGACLRKVVVPGTQFIVKPYIDAGNPPVLVTGDHIIPIDRMSFENPFTPRAKDALRAMANQTLQRLTSDYSSGGGTLHGNGATLGTVCSCPSCGEISLGDNLCRIIDHNEQESTHCNRCLPGDVTYILELTDSALYFHAEEAAPFVSASNVYLHNHELFPRVRLSTLQRYYGVGDESWVQARQQRICTTPLLEAIRARAPVECHDGVYAFQDEGVTLEDTGERVHLTDAIALTLPNGQRRFYSQDAVTPLNNASMGLLRQIIESTPAITNQEQAA